VGVIQYDRGLSSPESFGRRMINVSEDGHKKGKQAGKHTHTTAPLGLPSSSVSVSAHGPHLSRTQSDLIA
jgi:hypothetical protein